MRFAQRWTVVITASFVLFITLKSYENVLRQYGGIGIMSEIYTQYTVDTFRLEPLQDAEPLLPDIGPIFNDVTSFKYPLELRENNCPSLKDDTDPASLFVTVLSAPSNFEGRQAIRRTWADQLINQNREGLSHRVEVLGFAFILGLDETKGAQILIESESKKYGDIVQVGSNDSDLSPRKVAAALQWVKKNCPTIDYILQVQDDVYVNVKNLLDAVMSLSTTHSSSNGIYGIEMPYLDPQRNTNDQWYASFQVWPWTSFPVFLRSSNILIGGQSLLPLLAGMQTTPYLPFWDVYLTGLVAEKTGIPLYSNKRMFDIRSRFPLKECYAHGLVSWLARTPKEMSESHEAADKIYDGSGRRCQVVDEENEIRKDPKYERYDDPLQPVSFVFSRIKTMVYSGEY